MPSLGVRNLTDDNYEALRRRAAAAGRSMEAEARLVLEKAANEQPFDRPTPRGRTARLAT